MGLEVITQKVKKRIQDGMIAPLSENKETKQLLKKVFGNRLSNFSLYEKQKGYPANNLINEIVEFVLDVVVNHSSNEHKWFKQASSSRDNNYYNYYHCRQNLKKRTKTSGKIFNRIDQTFGKTIWCNIGPGFSIVSS